MVTVLGELGLCPRSDALTALGRSVEIDRLLLVRPALATPERRGRLAAPEICERTHESAPQRFLFLGRAHVLFGAVPCCAFLDPPLGK